MDIPKKIQPFLINKNKKGNDNTLIIFWELSCCNSTEFQVEYIGSIRKKYFLVNI